MSRIAVKIDTIGGDIVGTDYAGQISCTGMQLGVDLQVVSHGTQRTEGASIHGAVMLAHAIDKATPLLRAATAGSTSLGKVVITRLRQLGDNVQPAEIITLGSARLVAMYLDTPLKADGSGPEDFPVEVFVLDYDEIKWEYPIYEDGILSSTAMGSYSTTTMNSTVSI